MFEDEECLAFCDNLEGDSCAMNLAGEGGGGPLTKVEVVPALFMRSLRSSVLLAHFAESLQIECQ